ncbi:MAG: flotillin family protein [Planctomycetota bacterium]
MLQSFASLLPVLAAESSDPPWLVIGGVAIVLMVFSFVLLLVKRYKRCPSNRVLVVYGRVGGGISSKCYAGGAAFVIPLIQDYAWLSLEPIQIEVPLKDALSSENIRVNVPSIFTVAIGTQPEVMQNAAVRLLGLNTPQIKKQAEDIIFGQLRQVIAGMQIEDINRDRDTFLKHIQTSLEPELKKIGLVLINVNITDITDESGYIEAIGRKAAAEAINQAEIDVANQDKKGAIGVAEADREKNVSVANATKVKEIGVREATRDQAVRLAELEKEQRVAEERAAFERQSQIAEAEREKRVRIADANASAVTGENTAQAVIAGSRAELKIKEAEAYQAGESRQKEAEAKVLEIQNRALAQAALAEAERVENERRAELEAPAKAAKAKTIVEAEAEAEKRRIEAEGEASAIFARLEAQAKGEFEMLAKKGEGLGKIIEACGGSKEAFQLMMLEHLDTLANASARAISNIKFDKIVVWDGGGANGNGSATSGFLKGLAGSLPPILNVMKDIGGVDMPEHVAKLQSLSEDEGGPSDSVGVSKKSDGGKKKG